jgi:hypothetical protein
MANTRSRMMQEIHDQHGLNKPSVSGLLEHIVVSMFSQGMLSLLAFGSAVIALLGYNNITSGNYFVPLITSIVVLAFLNGCKAWQEDHNIYQKDLADARHTYRPHA